jgi:hypothetical protein
VTERQERLISTHYDFLPRTNKPRVLYLSSVANLGIILIGEVGGDGEYHALEFIKETRLNKEKPILAYFAGLCALNAYTMGHSGKSFSSLC